MLDAIILEIEMQRDYLDGQRLKTVYFGGGTPSLLDVSEIIEIWKAIERHYEMTEEMEVTLEANPDDLNLEKLSNLKNYSPINRLSIGIQSFRDVDLQYMNRAHNAQEAENCIENAIKIGFKELSADLIYGTPGMNDEAWRANLQKIFDYRIQHLSCYALTVEPKTALQHLIDLGKTAEVDEEHTARQFEILLESTAFAGYEQYEISNFCIPPHYAQHNSSYWNGGHYLGIGPSAHSYNGISRKWNLANNAKYIEEIESGKIPSETEYLTKEDQYNEFLMISLRTKWGLDADKIAQKWGNVQVAGFENKVEKYLKNGLMLKENEVYRLSDRGKLLADDILADLFV